ncbi:MAG: DEAD/DEAH box helicase [Lachnospiraceae bacterium]|nr:DEAD/DEAH box helicase [Lachnospiraceae bacterium]
MNITMRPYQDKVVGKVICAFASGQKNALIVLPTGLGKTCCMAAVAEDEVKKGGRVLFLAHRNTLLEQGAKEIEQMAGIKTENLKDNAGSSCPIVVSSVQTMSRPARLKEFRPDDFTMIMVDEAHHIVSDTYRSVIEYFSGAKLFGVTATPKRGDNCDIGEYFDEVASEYTVYEAIKDGWLSPLVLQNCPVNIDISGISTQSGDYAAGELGEILLPYLDPIANEVAAKAKDRKTIIFVPLISTAVALTKVFRDKGVMADYVAGSRSDSEEVMEKFRRNELKILINSMLLTEGYNEPSVNCLVNLRVTKSDTLMTQIVGRGTRKAPGKENCLVLDFFWKDKKSAFGDPDARRSLCAADIFVNEIVEDEKTLNEVIRRCRRYETEEPVDIPTLLLQIKEEVKEERENAMRRAKRREEEQERFEKLLLEKKNAGVDKQFWRLNEIRMNPEKALYRLLLEKEAIKITEDCYCIKNPLGRNFVYSKDKVLRALNLDHYEYPNEKSVFVKLEQKKETLPKGLRCAIYDLESFGVDPSAVGIIGYAEYLSDTFLERKMQSLCSYKQAKLLQRAGVNDLSGLGASEASRAIDVLSQNNWIPSADFWNIFDEDLLSAG